MEPETVAALASIPIALISGAVAVFASINASKASRVNTEQTTRVDMEKEAYIRARNHDVKTIEHQGKRIDELETDLKFEREERQKDRDEIKSLKRKIARMEAGLPAEDSSNGST